MILTLKCMRQKLVGTVDIPVFGTFGQCIVSVEFLGSESALHLKIIA